MRLLHNVLLVLVATISFGQAAFADDAVICANGGCACGKDVCGAGAACIDDMCVCGNTEIYAASVNKSMFASEELAVYEAGMGEFTCRGHYLSSKPEGTVYAWRYVCEKAAGCKLPNGKVLQKDDSYPWKPAAGTESDFQKYDTAADKQLNSDEQFSLKIDEYANAGYSKSLDCLHRRVNGIYVISKSFMGINEKLYLPKADIQACVSENFAFLSRPEYFQVKKEED